ncbi:fused MFS/spermidine synthase [candidate division KSB1 bacterium]
MVKTQREKSSRAGQSGNIYTLSYSGILLVLFTISGACGLAYEVVWSRQLTLFFGISTYSTMTVLAVFMVGLSAGSYLFGKIIDSRRNPLVIYGIIEIGIGVYAVALVVLLRIIQPVITALFSHMEPGLMVIFLRMVCAFFLLLPPTLLMGATFPVMNRVFISDLDHMGRRTGSLYAVNTFGAVIGAFLTGFFLLQFTGIVITTLTAAVLNVLIGIISLQFGGRLIQLPAIREEIRPEDAETQESEETRMQHGNVILLSAALSGFTFLAFEGLAIRILIQVLGNSSWAFSTILCCALTGIAAGSYIFSRFYDRIQHRMRLLAMLQLAAAVSLIVLIPAWNLLEGLNGEIFTGESTLYGFLIVQFIVTLSVVIIPTILIGAVLPLCIKLYCGRVSHVGSDIGYIYALNTLGAVAGVALTGLVLVPALGLRNCFILLSTLNAVIASVVLFHSEVRKKTRRALVSFSPLMVFTVIITGLQLNITIGKNLQGYELAYSEDGIGGHLAVFEAPDSTRVLNINNITEVATDDVSLKTFRMMAAVPLLVQPEIEEALIITFGAGIVSGTLAELGLQYLDCVEINPEIRNAAGFFKKENYSVIDNPKLRMIFEDGRNFLLMTTRRYDLISADATHPTGADSWVLFTREFYTLCSERLSERGIFSQWIPLHGISLRNLRIILSTINSIFPHMQVWFTGMDRNVGHILVIAAKEDVYIEFGNLQTQLLTDDYGRMLSRFHLNDPSMFIQHYFGDQNSLSDFFAGAPVNTDNKAYTAFPDRLLTQNNLIENLETLFAQRSPLPSDEDVVEERENESRYFQGMGSFWSGQIALFKNDITTALKSFGSASEELPEYSGVHDDIRMIIHNITEPFLDAAAELESERQFDRALEILAELEKNLPEQFQPLSEIGRIHLQNGEPALGKLYLLRAADSNPDFYAFFNLGVIYLGEDSLSRAEWAFRETIRLNPAVAQAHSNLGYIYHQQGKLSEARQAWETALRYDAGDQLALRGLEMIKQPK